MISQKVITLFSAGLNDFDKELEAYKKENNIDKPIFHQYFATDWIVPPYLMESGLYVDPKAPDFIVQKYTQIYNAAVIEASKP